MLKYINSYINLIIDLFYGNFYLINLYPGKENHFE